MFLAHKSMVQMNFYYKKQCWTFCENAFLNLENTFDKIQKSFWQRGVIDTPKYDSMTDTCRSVSDTVESDTCRSVSDTTEFDTCRSVNDTVEFLAPAYISGKSKPRAKIIQHKNIE